MRIIADAESSGMEWQSRECGETQFESDESQDLDKPSHFFPNSLPAESMAQDESFLQQESVTYNAGWDICGESNIHFGSICRTTRASPPLISAIVQSPILHYVPTSYATSSFTVAQDSQDQNPRPVFLTSCVLLVLHSKCCRRNKADEVTFQNNLCSF